MNEIIAVLLGLSHDPVLEAACRKSALLVLMCMSVSLVLVSILTAVLSREKAHRPRRIGLYITTVIVTAIFVPCLLIYLEPADPIPVPSLPPQTTSPSTHPADSAPETQPPETTQETQPQIRYTLEPVRTQANDPANFGVNWEIIEDGQIVDSFTRETPISFGMGEDYFALNGIATFRGNNYRNTSTIGTATVENATLEKVWTRSLGSLNSWSGSGWTGQPLIVQWDEETKAVMNLYEEKKAKEDLVEIIYATLDGYVYFYDLEDGSSTRPAIYLGMNFKGAGALDPRGYPLLYVGSGIYLDGKAPRMFVVSLIDGQILYQFGHNDGFIHRSWTAFDSSPLVSAQTDTLLWPGESGMIYTIKLNTDYDPQAGTITVDPDSPVRARYTSSYSNSGRYLGFEDSIVVVDHYMYLSDNSGLFYCVDLNTMELIWVQDTKDDSNSSPVFQWAADGDGGYLYTAPSLHWTATGTVGSVSVYKLDAETGEIIWEHPYKCKTIEDLSGGVQSTPLLGKEGTDIEGMIIYSVSRVPDYSSGVLSALDTETGEVIWEVSTGNYAWSSPTAIYTDDGKAYIYCCDADGDAKLYDGATGERLDRISFGSTVEASPVVWGNRIIQGTRGSGVYCVEIS